MIKKDGHVSPVSLHRIIRDTGSTVWKPFIEVDNMKLHKKFGIRRSYVLGQLDL